MKFYSQINQDEIYIESTKAKINGYFLDVGASDGTCFSNTKTLEESLGWAGLLFEPNPVPYKVCKATRKSPCFQIAIYDKETELTFSSPGNNLVGGIKEHLGTAMVEAMHKQGDFFKDFTVKTKTLHTALEENNSPIVIDYMSIDTEGSEPQILECFFRENNGKRKIHWVDVEHNHIPENMAKLKKIMKENGYGDAIPNHMDFTFKLL